MLGSEGDGALNFFFYMQLFFVERVRGVGINGFSISFFFLPTKKTNVARVMLTISDFYGSFVRVSAVSFLPVDSPNRRTLFFRIRLY